MDIFEALIVACEAFYVAVFKRLFFWGGGWGSPEAMKYDGSSCRLFSRVLVFVYFG